MIKAISLHIITVLFLLNSTPELSAQHKVQPMNSLTGTSVSQFQFRDLESMYIGYKLAEKEMEVEASIYKAKSDLLKSIRTSIIGLTFGVTAIAAASSFYTESGFTSSDFFKKIKVPSAIATTGMLVSCLASKAIEDRLIELSKQCEEQKVSLAEMKARYLGHRARTLNKLPRELNESEKELFEY